MKPSAIAKQIITEEKLIPIFQSCQDLINAVTVGITVSRNLNKTDANIIVEVVNEQLKKEIEEASKQEPVARAIQFRIKGLYLQFLKRKGDL